MKYMRKKYICSFECFDKNKNDKNINKFCVGSKKSCWKFNCSYNNTPCRWNKTSICSFSYYSNSIIKLPYEPLLSANITVPSDTAFIEVPVLHAISSPV